MIIVKRLIIVVAVVLFGAMNLWLIYHRKVAPRDDLAPNGAALGMFESDEAMMRRLEFPPEAYVAIKELAVDATPVQAQYKAKEGDAIKTQCFMVEPQQANFPRQSSWMDMGQFESKVKAVNQDTGAVTLIATQVSPGRIGVEGGTPKTFGLSEREYTRRPDGSIVAVSSVTIKGAGYSAEVPAMRCPPGQLVFPEGKITPGQRWSPPGAAGSPGAGQKTEYRFRGLADVGGTRCMVIEEQSVVQNTIHLKDESGQAHPVTVTATIQGTHYFDAAKGREHRRDLVQKTSVESNMPNLPASIRKLKSQQRLISFVKE